MFAPQFIHTPGRYSQQKTKLLKERKRERDDVGCFHGLDIAGRARYVEQLSRLVRPRGKFMLWALDRPALFEDYGISPEAVQRLFVSHFLMSHSEHGEHRGRPTTWYWFTRR